MRNRLWSEWKKRVAQIHNDDGSYEEYIQRLEEAQSLSRNMEILRVVSLPKSKKSRISWM